MSSLAKELNVVLPISFFEKDNNAYFNSIAVINSDGNVLGKYRKSHIPDEVAGYLEKYYLILAILVLKYGILLWKNWYWYLLGSMVSRSCKNYGT